MLCFLEGASEDVSFAKGVFGNLAREECSRLSKGQCSGDRNGNGPASNGDGQSEAEADSLLFFYTGEDPVCDQLMEALGLSEAPVPLIAIVDLLGDRLYVCDQPDVSEEIVADFVGEFRHGEVKGEALPVDCTKLYSPAHVGGIPLVAISAVLGMSPSQSSMGQSVLISADNSSSCNGSSC